MKFAHLSDCHVGGWREDELKALSVQAFCAAMKICTGEKVDFILIAGDLFNNSLPMVDALKEATYALKEVKEAGIPVYLVPGSHDYSPSGKSMLDVLERAGLCTNVYRFENGVLEFTIDKRTGVKITGMCGLRGGLEKLRYQELNLERLEREEGFKIFVFHTLLNELKGKQFEQVEGEPLAALPKNFRYYAGGHPHFVSQRSWEEYGLIAYPGPLFPNNFKEMEDLRHGGFYIVDENLNARHIPVELKKVVSFFFSAEGKNPQSLTEEMVRVLSASDVKDKIVLVRVEGMLATGKPSEVDFKRIREAVKSSYSFLKNTSRLSTAEFEEFDVDTGRIEDVERKIMEEHVGQIPMLGLKKEKECEMVHNLMMVLNKEKDEGERIVDFEQRILKDVARVIPVGEVE